MLIIFLLCVLTCPFDTLCRFYYDSTTGGLSTKPASSFVENGFCPETVSEWQMPGGRAQCQRLCEEDTECPGNQRCCTDLFGCGRQCRDPLPEYTCDNKKCEDGQSCVMNRNPFCTPGCTEGYTCIFSQPPGCVSPPCPKVARCRPLCDPYAPGINTGGCTVADLCSPFPAPGQHGCFSGLVCCRTICGNRCIPPYRGILLAAPGLVHGFDNPLCIARNCPSGTFCRIVVDSTTGVSSPKCLTCNPVCGSRTDVWMDVDHPHQTLVARAPMSAESSKLLPCNRVPLVLRFVDDKPPVYRAACLRYPSVGTTYVNSEGSQCLLNVPGSRVRLDTICALPDFELLLPSDLSGSVCRIGSTHYSIHC
ncbi:hypothetical protein C0Q70_11569 [Pomacea canaliculata]|uniref:WAP domain-containing protein n=1 Tax=Pomacea canaliculata TaxID=400727 RepID=A0A2T7P6B2_POMCA|nr:hypothetical protein C0Q70_11569 [Pomacea canaliculata]